jgi:hypothetical protein
VPARFEDLRAIGEYDVGLDSDAARTWLTGNAKEMDKQTAVEFIKKFVNPNYNQAHYNDIQKIHDAYVKGTPADQIQSANTLFDHLGNALEASEGYRRSNGGELLNKPLSWWGQNMSGDPYLMNLQAAIEPVKSEFFTFLKNNRALSNHDEKYGENIMNWNMSPAVLEGQLKIFAQTAANRLYENDQRWQRVMGTGKHVPGLISDSALNAIGKLTNADGTNPIADTLKDMDTGGSFDGPMRGTMGRTVGEALSRKASAYQFTTKDGKMGWNGTQWVPTGQ